MGKRIAGVVSLAAAATLVLVGCAQPEQEDLGDIESIGDSNIIDAITEELNDVDSVIADAKSLFFDNGFYVLSYTEEVMDPSVQSSTTAEGIISFREDGSCAFEVEGVQTTSDGTEVPYRFFKDYVNTAGLRYGDEPFTRVDPAEYEPLLAFKLPSLGPFPRSADFAGFCGVQSLSLYVDRAERAPGTGTWNSEKGDAFVADQFDAYYSNMFSKLGLNKISEDEARAVLSELYFGSDTMPIWEPVVEFPTDPNTGIVTIRSGVPGETNYAELILEPRSAGSSERQLEYVQEFEGSWSTQLDFFIETYGSGDKYIESLIVE